MTTTDTLERASTAAPRPELDWERDWQGRPRILPDPTWDDTHRRNWQGARANDDGGVEYTRVTTFAEALQDSSALTRWKMRRAVLGMGRRPDYVTTAASLTTEDRDRQALDDLAEKALEAAGPNAADVGTALHAFTERLDRGEDVGAVPEQYVQTLDAYRQVVAHLRFTHFEVRTVCDQLETAGTPDRFGYCDIPDPDGVVDDLRVIDTKTGRVDYSAGKFSTQLAIYAHSDLYHPGTGQRTPLEVNTRWGLVTHVPAGAGVAELLWLDLQHGWDGAQLCQQVRKWRTGAKAGELLRPVFARPPRPRPMDGTCRGRKQDGQPCGYKAKTREADLGAQFCGRHQDQAVHLSRWLAENPGVDPDAGTDTAPSMSPIQPAIAPVQLEAPAATDENTHRVRLGDALLMFAGKFPNGMLIAPVGAHAQSAEDGRRWVKAERDDAHGWVLDRADAEATAERNVRAVLGADEDRCDTTGLLVSACACNAHRGGLTPEEEAAQEIPPLDVVLQGLPPKSLAYVAAVNQWRDMAGAPEDHPNVQAALERHRVARGEQVAPLRELDGDDAYPDHGPEDDAAAAMGLPSQTVGERIDSEHGRPVSELEPVYGPPVGTYALDPAAEINGNPRPVSGLQTPEDAHRASLRQLVTVQAQLMAARSASELELIYRQHAGDWTPQLSSVADSRLLQLREEERRERPEAALLSALETAPDMPTLARLWQQYGGGGLWTAEASTLAQRRWEQLQAAGEL